MLTKFELSDDGLLIESRLPPDARTQACAWVIAIVTFATLVFLWSWFLSSEPWNPPDVPGARRHIARVFSAYSMLSLLLPWLLTRQLRGVRERFELSGIQMIYTCAHPAILVDRQRVFDLCTISGLTCERGVGFYQGRQRHEIGRTLTRDEAKRVAHYIRLHCQRLGLAIE